MEQKHYAIARQLNEVYVEFFNHYFTHQGYADLNYISDELATILINAGRAINKKQELLDIIYAGVTQNG